MRFLSTSLHIHTAQYNHILNYTPRSSCTVDQALCSKAPEERLPPCHFLPTDWCVYTGCINREPCGTRRRTQSASICPTQLTTSHSPTPHHTRSRSRHRATSHVGLHRLFKRAAGTDWHMCAWARACLIIPHKLSEVCARRDMCGAAFVNARYFGLNQADHKDDVGCGIFAKSAKINSL